MEEEEGREGRGAAGEKADREMAAADDRETVDLTTEDCAFVCGRGGSTKMKLARVSGASLELSERDLKMYIEGSPEAVSRARDYIGFVLAQRVGPVQIDTHKPREDLSVVDVPHNCVAYVMGRGGNVLRNIEEEWSTLMFFAKEDDPDKPGEVIERLCIFGSRRARRGAELKVMSAIEYKMKGHFLSKDPVALKAPLNQAGDGDQDGEDWGYATRVLADDELSYALGARGSTRKKLAEASGCIVEYLQSLVVFAGDKGQRQRAQDYMNWLLEQKTGPVTVNIEGRDDVDVVKVPSKSMGYVTGGRGANLREMERRSGTFMFSNGSPKNRDGADEETLLIFSYNDRSRRRAVRMVEDTIDEHQSGRAPPLGVNRFGGGGGGRGGGGGYGDRGGGGGYGDRGGGGGYGDRGGGGYGDRGRGGYDDRGRGGYDDRGRGGGYDDRGRGGYDDRGRGGYDDRGRGGYDDRGRGGYDDRGRGGYDDRGRGGGYDDRGRGGGYDDRGRGGHRSRSPRGRY